MGGHDTELWGLCEQVLVRGLTNKKDCAIYKDMNQTTLNKTEYSANLNAVGVINDLFKLLYNDRERDVLSRRFGLSGDKKETLESIGNSHGLTRERVRQIEAAGIKRLREAEDLKEYLTVSQEVIKKLLEEHGGLMEEKYLLDILVNIFTDSSLLKNEKDEQAHKNHFDFLISKLLRDDFEKLKNSDYFKRSYTLKHEDLDHLEEVVKELLAKIKEAKEILNTKELLELATGLESFGKHEEKLKKGAGIDISQILNNDLFLEEDKKIINLNKVLYSILQASHDVDQNKFGHWGIKSWPEISPKTINDKIYLILKNLNKPIHFTEITDRINEVVFDRKKANAATVHNELILDNKFVLVGKGIYSLKEWGYKEGTVADIIAHVLEGKKEPMKREDIIDEVLEQRFVKDTTVILALMNKDKFEKVEDGKYKLKKD